MGKPAEADAEQTAARLLKQINQEAQRRNINGASDVAALPAAGAVSAATPAVQVAFLRAAADQIAAIRKKLGSPRRNESDYLNLDSEDDFPWAATFVMGWLLRRNLPLTGEDQAYLVARTADVGLVSVYGGNFPYLNNLMTLIEKQAEQESLNESMKKELGRLAKALDWGDNNAVERKLIARLDALREGFGSLPIQPGEAWSDAALAELKKMKSKERQAWEGLLRQCAIHNPHKPSNDWLANAKPLLKAVGFKSFQSHLKNWAALVGSPGKKSVRIPNTNRTDNTLLSDHNANVLRGLVWCCPLTGDAALSRMLADLAAVCFAKIPGRGQRSPKVGNACVYSLGELPGTEPVAQLGRLRLRVKNRLTEQLIDNALIAAAIHRGMSKEELEEVVVPAYGLTDVGVRREQFGEFMAELVVAGPSNTELRWYDATGRVRKSLPAVIRTDFAGDLRELKLAAKDIQKTLPVQRGRLEQLFLRRKTWNLETWRERYLEHPLVGILGRRLIWTFTTLKKTTTGIWHDGQIVDVDDRPLIGLGDRTTVALWHPIGQPDDEVLAWHNWLEKHQLRQPFKQAHREIYMLTDAERNTGVYSNRYAAHVLKQHQFNALCGIRGWKNKLRLLVDQEFPPASLDLPAWNLRAEFWIEGAGDDYGTDTNEAGTFLYLTTDQVRFYMPDPDADPLPLETIPPLVFSEVMRDVDLFVGVASVGNDPNWSDGGPDGRYRGYWQSYAFGDLSATAQTRRAVLERLIPRLKIADRCSFSDKFLQVHGDLRSYKIHLGSGNILMTPNDQYLCIVPKQSATAGGDKVFLPFEGDSVLSQILSKALLLAEDKKITDPTIVSQIRSTPGIQPNRARP